MARRVVLLPKSEYVAVVGSIVAHGKHGAYAVSHCKQVDGAVTFGLNTPVWMECDWPEPGMEVLVTELRKKRAGWRAMKARYVQPEDIGLDKQGLKDPEGSE